MVGASWWTRDDNPAQPLVLVDAWCSWRMLVWCCCFSRKPKKMILTETRPLGRASHRISSYPWEGESGDKLHTPIFIISIQYTNIHRLIPIDGDYGRGWTDCNGYLTMGSYSSAVKTIVTMNHYSNQVLVSFPPSKIGTDFDLSSWSD